MNAVFHFLETTVIVVGALVALTLGLVVLIACLPNSPLRGVLSAVTKRIGTTAAVAVVGAPVELIPGVDGLYDVAGLIFLIWYWGSLFKSVAQILQAKPLDLR